MHNALNERMRAFDAAEHFAKDEDPAWEALKERGNEALKCGQHLSAAHLYEKAAQLALGPLEGGMVSAFIEALESWPEGSVQRQLLDNEDVFLESLLAQLHVPSSTRELTLPDGSKERAKRPNRAAAIAFANRAQALLLADQPREALKSARRAVEANPAYLKAHHREMKALQVLGKAEEASELRKEMATYERLRTSGMQEGLALVAVGWINWMRAKMIYLPARFASVLEALVDDLPENERRVEVRASLVPFQGGQGLMLSLVDGFKQRQLECLDFYMVDTKNGELADKPPMGHASEKALMYSPQIIGKFIEEVGEYGLVTVSVMCGQGLTEHVQHIDQKLKQLSMAELGDENGILPMRKLVVYPASSTAASEDSGVRPPAFDFSDGAMAAAAARLGLNFPGLNM